MLITEERINNPQKLEIGTGPVLNTQGIGKDTMDILDGHWTVDYLSDSNKMGIVRNRLRNKIEGLIYTKGPIPYTYGGITLSLESGDLILDYKELGITLSLERIRDESNNSLPDITMKKMETKFSEEQRIDYFTQAIINRFLIN